MQGVDSFLADELYGVADVVSDSRIGSGISRGVYWMFHAQSQTKRLHQRATVMSVGAAVDAFPIPDALGVDQPCCGATWIAAYAARVRAIMLTFLQGGRGKVVWMTPPEPRDAQRAEITHAINVAVERAATGLAGRQGPADRQALLAQRLPGGHPLPGPRRARARGRRRAPQRGRHGDRGEDRQAALGDSADRALTLAHATAGGR